MVYIRGFIISPADSICADFLPLGYNERKKPRAAVRYQRQAQGTSTRGGAGT